MSDVVIVDCGIGNIKSVQRMLQAAGAIAEIVDRPDRIERASRLVLPGVGAFDAGMSALQNGWLEPLRELALIRKIPVLGICLGMQLLCRRSEEGRMPGLGWIEADVRQLDTGGNTALKLPHMGWSAVTPAGANPLIPSDEGEQRFYHVHRYRAVCDREEDVLATAEYGRTFTTAVRRENIFGVQFHPEKSHRFGLALMRRFVSLSC
jgi:imidazole glycerol-phosphate synthase subunit HisH